MSILDEYFSVIQHLNAGEKNEALRALTTSIKNVSGADHVIVFENDRDRNKIVPQLALDESGIDVI